MEKCFDYIRIASFQVVSNMSSTDHHISDRMQSETDDIKLNTHKIHSTCNQNRYLSIE
jgi:hypothetical protein